MLFVSYSWVDAAHAHRFADALAAARQSIWVDVRDLNLDGDIRSQLIDAICAASVVLHIDTEYSRNSQWVAFERTVALAMNKTVVDVPPEYLPAPVSSLLLDRSCSEPLMAHFLD